MVKIIDALRNLIVRKKSQGLSLRKIGNELNIGNSTVQKCGITSWELILRQIHQKVEDHAQAVKERED